MKSGMKGLVTGFNRRTFQLKEKIVRSESSTHSVEYSNQKSIIENDSKKLQLILQHIKKTVDNFNSIQVFQSELGMDFSVLYGEGPLTSAMNCYKEISEKVKEAQTRFAERMSVDVIDPLIQYVEQFKACKKRSQELSNRRIDMDRYNDKRLSLANKQNLSNQGKLVEIDSKYALSKTAYEELLKELNKDFFKLHNDVSSFIVFVFAGFVRYKAEFLNEIANLFNVLPPQVSSVNIELIHSHRDLITPLEMSTVMERNISQNSKSVPSAPSFTQARALFDFAATDSSELSFSAGNVLTILTQNGPWWDAEFNGRRGQIPANYVTIITPLCD